MTNRTIDLSGQFVIQSLSATEMVFASPEEVNPNWAYVNFDGAGSTGYNQNVSMVLVPETVPFDFNGSYTIASGAGSVTSDTITLNDPTGTSSDWTDFFASIVSGQTGNTSAFLSKVTDNWIGPFIVEGPETSLLVANFVAQGGLFKDSGKKQTAFPITIEIESTHVDSDDLPLDTPETFSVTIAGNAKGRDLRAGTKVCELANPGRQSVRARRTTNADYAFKGTVVDEVKWEDLYGISAVEMDDFGNVTTVHSRTYTTEGALNLKERKLNMVATRVLNPPDAAPLATNDAAEIAIAICLDPHLGNRTNEEVDVDAIRAAVQDARDYFGTDDAGEFCFTFDDDKTSFEEMLQTVAQAVFCEAHRQGSRLFLEFEGATEASTLLYNHRNKVPATEKRTISFGVLDDNDGIELTWRDPDNNDAEATIYIPADRSAVNAREIKTVGVRNRRQAYWLARRAWGKMAYQHTAVEFRATQEAALSSRGQRILVADNTRADTQDGEVLAQDGLELTLSQPVDVAGSDYHIFLQLPDGTIEAIAVTAGTDPDTVVLSTAPSQALSLDEDLYARATFEIAADEGVRSSAFLVTEKDPDDGFTFTLRAVNYSFLYYAADQLELWLDFLRQYVDAGPWQRDGLPAGDAAVRDDETLGRVSHGTGSGDRIDLPAFNAPASYTKSFWARRASLSGTGSVLSSTSTHERVYFDAGFGGAGALTVAQGGVDRLSISWGGSVEDAKFVAVTYDADSTTLSVYLDGVLVDSDSSIAQRTLGSLHAVGYNGGDGFAGDIGDLRLYNRALTPTEIRAIYRQASVTQNLTLYIADILVEIAGETVEMK